MITHTSITQKPGNFEKCAKCGGQLPPGEPRAFITEIHEDNTHKHSYQHIRCPSPGPEKAPPAVSKWEGIDLNRTVAEIAAEAGCGMTTAFNMRTAAGIKRRSGPRFNGRMEP